MNDPSAFRFSVPPSRPELEICGVTVSVAELTSASFASTPCAASTTSGVRNVVVYASSPAIGGSGTSVIVKLVEAVSTPPFAVPPESATLRVTVAVPYMPVAGV